ncbi:hypothetical protein [Massilia sp. TN1-12]|uniref:hypothetical protein n=1 Tax=Massilia paldalensis TaxID=3377675 RepID=UPI00384A5B34
MRAPVVITGAIVTAALAWAGWRLDARGLLAAWLATWWFVTGALLGGLANVWLHQLTGGAWGEAIRPPLLRAARWLPLACLLFLPVLLGMHALYPWLDHPPSGKPEEAFRDWWLSPGFFVARSIGYLLLWSALAWIETRSQRRSAGRAAAFLLLYGVSVGLAAVDWIMSLQPHWYSSIFGWLAGAGQVLAGMALAVLLADREAIRARLPDLGNLLLMYVLVWGYLSYSQFLVIWAADLPHEISWYLRRSDTLWKTVAWLLAAVHLFAPLALLLARRAKRAPRVMGMLAGTLLGAHLLDCWWLVLPSVEGLQGRTLWFAPAAAAVLAVLAMLVRLPVPARGEGNHA